MRRPVERVTSRAASRSRGPNRAGRSGVTRTVDPDTVRCRFKAPVAVEFILERVTNISMSAGIDAIVEFEELAESNEDAPTIIALLD